MEIGDVFAFLRFGWFSLFSDGCVDGRCVRTRGVYYIEARRFVSVYDVIYNVVVWTLRVRQRVELNIVMLDLI